CPRSNSWVQRRLPDVGLGEGLEDIERPSIGRHDEVINGTGASLEDLVRLLRLRIDHPERRLFAEEEPAAVGKEARQVSEIGESSVPARRQVVEDDALSA